MRNDSLPRMHPDNPPPPMVGIDWQWDDSGDFPVWVSKQKIHFDPPEWAVEIEKELSRGNWLRRVTTYIRFWWNGLI